MTMAKGTTVCLIGLAAAALSAPADAALPDHPVITEVYTDPNGTNDGPVGRDLTNPHQEFIEIYLPPAAALNPGLNKDALRLTFYEVEGDSNSSGLGLVNYRFDLPTLDLDPSNGTTPGAVARPSSGVVVLGWVDYVGDPPTGLAGTPSTRVGLVNGGITLPPPDYVFVAINGHHFGGTTNFPILTAESLIDLPSEARSGIVQNGSGAYLLVNRDSPGYVQLYDDQHVPQGGSANPDLPSGNVLRTTALLDGHAGNDHPRFVVTEQPYQPPTGEDIDLETVLPLGGAFSMLVAQVAEEDVRPTPGTGNGYARRFVDVPKTTENGLPDDPVADALNAYRLDKNNGPFFPTPGKAVLTTSPPELSVAGDPEQVFDVLSQTTGRPAVLAANAGGNFGIDISASGGTSSNPAVATFGPGTPATGVLGQTLGLPTVTVSVGANAAHLATASATITVSAINSSGGDPPVQRPVQTATVTARVLKPTTGQNANGQPFQTTVFLAVQGVVSDPGVANELLGTDLGAFLVSELGRRAQDSLGNGAVLTNPATNIGDPVLMQAMIEDFPDIFVEYINRPGPPGRLDLVQTVLTSAEVQSGASTYDDSFNPERTAMRAIDVNNPDTRAFGGTFTPSEFMYFADPKGFAGDPRSGLTSATTSRTFEMVLIDTQVTDTGALETGATDDFGVILEVALTEPGSPVVTGEFVFLSFTGGLQGADIDGLAVPPGNTIANLVYLDLDNLHDVLGIRSIERVFLIDGSGSGEADIVEVFSLNPDSLPPGIPGDFDGDGDVDLSDFTMFQLCFGGSNNPPAPTCPPGVDADLDGDGDVDLADFLIFQQNFTGSL